MMNDNYLVEILDYGKSAVLPKRIKQAYVHHPSSYELLSGFEHVVLTKNDSLAIHFRSLVLDGVKDLNFSIK
jgi:hypothetical protein